MVQIHVQVHVHVPSIADDPDRDHVLVRQGAEADSRRGQGGAQVEEAGLALGPDLVTHLAQEAAVVKRGPLDVVHGPLFRLPFTLTMNQMKRPDVIV